MIFPKGTDRRIKILFYNAKVRCSCSSPRNTKNYINKGIKFYLTHEDIIYIWKRDKGHTLNKPSLHRKNNNDNYCLENCEIIEWDNHRLMPRKIKIVKKLSIKKIIKMTVITFRLKEEDKHRMIKEAKRRDCETLSEFIKLMWEEYQQGSV